MSSVSPVDDVIKQYLRDDLAQERRETARLRERLREANERIGALEMELLRRKTA